MSHKQASLWRFDAEAERLFRAAVDETASAVGEQGELSLAEFWRELQFVLGSIQLRAPNRRRNVVHVMDVYEARQWELPVVFVCGLVERQFPQHHQENPLFGDATRRRLRADGIQLPTSRERDDEEGFLFDLATTRASERLVLSYPLTDSQGEETLRSFLLERFREESGTAVEEPGAVRPRATSSCSRSTALFETHPRTSTKPPAKYGSRGRR
ncbi:MAG: hypothetical protein GY953_05755 [bacterium]|nr:hypothetical protein [bacterium]